MLTEDDSAQNVSNKITFGGLAANKPVAYIKKKVYTRGLSESQHTKFSENNDVCLLFSDSSPLSCTEPQENLYW